MNKTFNKAVKTTLSAVNKVSPVKLNKTNLLMIILAIVVIMVLIPKLYKSNFLADMMPSAKKDDVETISTESVTTSAPVDAESDKKEETDDVKTTLAPTEIVKQAEGLLDKLKSLISKLFSKLK